LEQIFDIPTALAGWFSFWSLTSVAWVILWLALITALFIKRDEMSGRRNIGADRQLDHDAVKEFYNHF
jgi:hypothetical protein